MAEEMAHYIGRALEEIARSTASVAHFYREVRIGDAPGQIRIDTEAFNRDF